MQDNKKIDDSQIVESPTYLSEINVAIRQINDCILQGKNPIDAAENLYTDLPKAWRDEIEQEKDIANKKYNKIVEEHNKYLATGTTPNQKYNAQKAIYNAGKEYSLNVKMICVDILDKKIGLFKTRKAIEKGYLSLYATEPGQEIEDD